MSRPKVLIIFDRIRQTRSRKQVCLPASIRQSCNDRLPLNVKVSFDSLLHTVLLVSVGAWESVAGHDEVEVYSSHVSWALTKQLIVLAAWLQATAKPPGDVLASWTELLPPLPDPGGAAVLGGSELVPKAPAGWLEAAAEPPLRDNTVTPPGAQSCLQRLEPFQSMWLRGLACRSVCS